MELTYTATREGRLSSFLRDEMKMSSGLVNRLKWQQKIFVNGNPQHNDYRVQVGDVISFFDPAGKGTTVVTHRVTGITEKDGELYFRTKGDYNNTEDRLSVPEENLVGRWTETRFAGLGRVAMFMQSTAGLIVCIGVPLAALVAYELLRYKKANKQKQGDVDALMAELAALKAKQAAQEESKDEQGE